MAYDFNAHLVFIVVEFYIPQSNSLKVKRKVVKSIVERIRNKFNASVSELAYLDKWQRAAIGISMLNNNRKVLEKHYSGIEQLLRGYTDIELLNLTIEWI
jgi:uncharacterized protein YlxP (DUF503 family)